MNSLFLELSKQQNLLRLMEERGYVLCQQNGQRTYGGPPPNWGPKPPPHRDCEVFIGRLPRMCFEDELIPLFATVGELYEFRLMLDFSGTNRGYAYAHYTNLEGAMRAIRLLNRYEIRPGHFIGVLKSKNNCRLLLGNIKSTVTFNAFNEFIRGATPHVLSVFMFTHFDELRVTEYSVSLDVEEAFLERMPRNSVGSQFAIVEYMNHRSAAVARRVLIPKFGHVLAVDWAVPPRDRKRDSIGNGHSPPPQRPFKSQNMKANSVSGNFSMKARPVPMLLISSSIFDNIAYMPRTFRTVVKYFQLLINCNLYETVNRGEIPSNVYLEIEKKIVHRITNLENCSQAIQLIFNYLSWYNEKKLCMIDSETRTVLQEVKMYSDSIVYFMYNKIAERRPLDPALQGYYCDVLPVQLNVIYHLAVALSAEERKNLCGRITSSLQWFYDCVEKIKTGDEKVRRLWELISHIELEPNDMITGKDDLLSLEPFWIRRNGNTSNIFSNFHQSANNSSYPQNMAGIRDFDSLNYDTPNSGLSLMTSPVSSEESNSEFTVTSELGGDVSSFKREINVDAELGINQYYPQNSISPDFSRNMYFNYVPNVVNGTHENIGRPNISDVRVNGTENTIQSADTQKAGNIASIPVLNSSLCLTDSVTFMPKTLQNAVKYFRYLINVNLHRMAQRSEIPYSLCKEIEKKIVEHIINLEGCAKAIDLINDCLSWHNSGKFQTSDCEAVKVLNDLKMYCTSFINYIYNREYLGQPVNLDVDNYYCRLLPLQLSFLFHLALISSGDEQIQLSGRISTSLMWLNELIHKNQCGNIDMDEFFERFVHVSLKNVTHNQDKNAEYFIRATLREACKEFYMITESLKVTDVEELSHKFIN